MAADPSLLYAEPEVLLQALATPNDPMYAQQWGHFEATAGMRLPGAWDLSTGSGVVVGVLDTGYRPHADLAANIVPGYDFVTDTTIANDDGRDGDASDRGEGCSSGQRSWHCTHLAGVAALRHSRNPKLTPDEIDVACSNCGIEIPLRAASTSSSRLVMTLCRALSRASSRRFRIGSTSGRVSDSMRLVRTGVPLTTARFAGRCVSHSHESVAWLAAAACGDAEVMRRSPRIRAVIPALRSGKFANRAG